MSFPTSLIFTAIASLLASTLCAQPLTPVPVKQIAAPPSDIESGLLKLPDPANLGVTSRTALFEVDPQRADENGLIDFNVPLMITQGQGRVVFLPAEENAWVGIVTPLNRNTQQSTPIRTDNRHNIAGVSREKHPLPWGNAGRMFDAITLPVGIEAMHIQIELKKPVPGFVLIDQGTDRELYTYVDQRRTLVHHPISLISSLSDGSKIVTLRAIVRAPDGSRESIQADFDNADRISFTPNQPGKYTVHVHAEYADRNNNPVVLTTQHVIHAAKPAPLLKSPTAISTDDHVAFTFAPDDSTRRTILAAEVWGRKAGVLTPVAWISNIVASTRSLTLDTRWVALAGVDPDSLELRAVRLHDIDSFVPIEIIGRIPVPIQHLTLPEVPPSITPDMRTGTFKQTVPSPLPPQITQSAGPGHRLFLIHGYCTDANPYPTSQFTGDLAVFEDFNQSRSHDEFALNILAQSAPTKSFGVVAHSQGGIASLHLLNFYWSGLDWAKNGTRLIQTVGSPYQGTALAGNAAILGDIFGFGCGENENLTYTGSANWLSLIPTAARQQVYYHTTSFEDGFGFDYCNLITDLLLSDPDDGVTEKTAGQLPGANNMGHLEGWCHTADMRDPSQCTDQSRNIIMNQEAKR